ncbi:MAG: MotA/TolQ/ExbB proton channel family protein [Saprospiraceae bacterium]
MGADTTGQGLLVNPTAAAAQKSVMDIILSSGPLGVGIIAILMILSFMAVYIFIERYLTISKAGSIDNAFMNNVRMAFQSGNLQGAKSLCQSVDSPMARMLEKGIARIGNEPERIEKEMENIGKVELYKLEKNMSILSLIARLSPMFGFVGTILGVIKIFYDISLTDNLSIGTISGGLYQKMITSATGLMVGIIAFVGYYILTMKIDKVLNMMEKTSIEFLDFIQEPGK